MTWLSSPCSACDNRSAAMKLGSAVESAHTKTSAGPSEVLVWADSTADPNFIAADLLSQAEHGEDSQVILVTNEEGLVSAVQAAIGRQLKVLPRKAIAEKALASS